MVQLTDELRAALDAEAHRRRVSRSEVVREAVETYLAASREAELDRQIVEGYTRIPPGREDEWGDLAAQQEASAVEAHASSAASERRRGRGR